MRTCSRMLHRMKLSHSTVLVILFLALGASTKPAFAGDSDRVSFGQRIVVTQDETAGDLVCFLCSIDIHGHVEGDVVSFLGGVKNTGTVSGDMVSLLGDVNLSEASSVNGSMVVIGGNLRRSQGARLGSDQVVLPIAVVFLPLLLVVAIVWAIARVFRRPAYFAPIR